VGTVDCADCLGARPNQGVIVIGQLELCLQSREGQRNAFERKPIPGFANLVKRLDALVANSCSFCRVQTVSPARFSGVRCPICPQLRRPESGTGRSKPWTPRAGDSPAGESFAPFSPDTRPVGGDPRQAPSTGLPRQRHSFIFAGSDSLRNRK
jgi:hypothetical protein